MGCLTLPGSRLPTGRIGSDGKLTFADVPLGTYTVRELDTPPKGYLLDDTAYPVTLLWEGEDKPLVKVQLEVSEPVKKQKQVIYKVGGDDDATVMEWTKMRDSWYFPIRIWNCTSRQKMAEHLFLTSRCGQS